MGELTLGVVGTSRKPDERRVPIHPRHLERIEPGLRARMVVERGYGMRFGVPDDVIAGLVGRMAERAEVVASSDVVLLPKPQLDDIRAMRDGQVLWGWPHLVQDSELTQLAIDRKLTLIAWDGLSPAEAAKALGCSRATLAVRLHVVALAVSALAIGAGVLGSHGALP